VESRREKEKQIKITKYKLQNTNKPQIPNYKSQAKLRASRGYT
jgi:hypothetical protein